jgi:RHS repeat-associated protein
VISVTGSTGTVLGLNKYDEYGVPQSTNLGKFGYTGQAWVPEVGLWYYKARMYRPGIGRFMQTDPIPSTNLYAYVTNDPINLSDPLGLQDEGGEVLPPVIGIRHLCQGICYDGPPDIGLLDFYWTLQFEEFGGTRDRGNQCKEALEEANQDETSVQRAKGSWEILSQAATSHSIPTGFLAAIGVRETGFMNIPERGGGRGMGVFQLTNQPGVTSAQAYNLSFSANYAANMLSSNMNYLSAKFDFTPAQLLQATAASYNFGRGNISGNPATIDVGTAPGGNLGNYGSNVIDLMSCFRE